MLGSAGNKQTF